MSIVSSLGPQPSALGADTFRPADAFRPAAGADVAGRAWFQDWGREGPSSALSVLHADVEADAKGLSADQHAERVLSHLIESR